MVDKTKKTLQERITELEGLINKAKDEAKRYSELYKTRQAELENLKVLLEKEALEAEKALFDSVGVTSDVANRLKNSGVSISDLLELAGVPKETQIVDEEADINV